MATEQVIESLEKIISDYNNLDREKIIKKSLGVESLEKEIPPVFDMLDEMINLVQDYSFDVHTNIVQVVVNSFTTITNLLTALGNYSSSEFITNKQSVIDQINAQIDEMKAQQTHFISAAVMAKGFLNDKGIRKEYDKTILSLRSEAQDTLEQLKREATSSIEEARKLAEEIEGKARRTAAKISVQEVQEQFESASTPLFWQSILWSSLSVISLIVFFIVLYSYLDIKFPKEWSWQIAFETGIRITLLGTIGSLAAFCLKMFKSYLHMFNHNKHRQRVANSIESFVESAITPEQRDSILSKLVDSISDFGSTGLLSTEENNSSSQKMIIDNVTRSVSPFHKE